MLMSAFAYHEGAQYAESRAAAQRYLEFFPADVDAPYAQFLIALSYYDQIVDIGRDQSDAFDALQEMRDIIERYPDSEYAKSAQMKFELALDHLAGKEMEIGRYYLARGYYTAAINRFRVVVEEYQTTTQTPEALHRLVEALSLARSDQGGADRSGDPWLQLPGLDLVRDSYALLTGRGPAARRRRRQLAEPDLSPGRAGRNGAEARRGRPEPCCGRWRSATWC